MSKSKKTTTESTYTQIIPVASCADIEQVRRIMDKSGVARAETYNKLGSLQGWSLHWTQADPIIRSIVHPDALGIPSKLYEWAVNDCMKAISAQQEAAKTFISRAIWNKIPATDIEKQRWAWLRQFEKPTKAQREQALELYPATDTEKERDRLIDLMHNDPTADPWLHRKFRKQYQKGHTFQRNQIVYQKGGYKATRVKDKKGKAARNLIKLEIAGLKPRKRIEIIVRSQRLPVGQIRLIETEAGLEVHTGFKRSIPVKPKTKTRSVGLDKGYTEGFYTSDGQSIAPELGKMMTAKTEQTVQRNRNRYRLWQHQKKLAKSNRIKAARMLDSNLTYKVKGKRLKRDKATIQNLIRRDLRRNITAPTRIIAEDLSTPIKGKKQAKRINRKLNQWMKGALQASVERIAEETGSTVKTVNPAYTSQVDSLTGTLLGRRNGDSFTRHTGVVLQADENAANNILQRGDDAEITRYMRKEQVLAVLLERTIRYLHSNGRSVPEALELGWLPSKFKAKALKCESGYLRQG